MANDKNLKPQADQCCKKKWESQGGPSGAIYGLGFIGAAVYFIQHAPTFWDGVIGILKAIIWPALLSYKLLEFFNF